MAPSQIQRSSAGIKPVEVNNLGGSTTKSCRRVCDLGANRNAPLTSVDAKDQEAPAAFLKTHLRAVASTPPAYKSAAAAGPPPDDGVPRDR